MCLDAAETGSQGNMEESRHVDTNVGSRDIESRGQVQAADLKVITRSQHDPPAPLMTQIPISQLHDEGWSEAGELEEEKMLTTAPELHDIDAISSTFPTGTKASKSQEAIVNEDDATAVEEILFENMLPPSPILECEPLNVRMTGPEESFTSKEAADEFLSKDSLERRHHENIVADSQGNLESTFSPVVVSRKRDSLAQETMETVFEEPAEFSFLSSKTSISKRLELKESSSSKQESQPQKKPSLLESRKHAFDWEERGLFGSRKKSKIAIDYIPRSAR
jgi:hypothetical protein